MTLVTQMCSSKGARSARKCRHHEPRFLGTGARGSVEAAGRPVGTDVQLPTGEPTNFLFSCLDSQVCS